MKASRAAYEPGDVLVISKSSTRAVALSSKAVSTHVAGVYATKPGVLLTQDGIDEDHDMRVPLAIAGIVPTKVTTENGPIQPGDLLVTSSRKGHAMKAPEISVDGYVVSPAGAIIGKAMQPFEGPGAGVIEVLVGLR